MTDDRRMLLICWDVLYSAISEMEGNCQRKCFSAVSPWCYRSSSKPELHIEKPRERKPLRLLQHVLLSDCEWFYSGYAIYIYFKCANGVCRFISVCVCGFIRVTDLQNSYSWTPVSGCSGCFRLFSFKITSPCFTLFFADEKMSCRRSVCVLICVFCFWCK